MESVENEKGEVKLYGTDLSRWNEETNDYDSDDYLGVVEATGFLRIKQQRDSMKRRFNMTIRDVKHQVEEMIEEGFGSREIPHDFSLFDFLDLDSHAMRTFFVRSFLIIVKNSEGVPYAIDGEYLQDLIDDWNDEALSCPENDARVLFFMYNGEPVNPCEYDTFESVIRWMQNHIK